MKTEEPKDRPDHPTGPAAPPLGLEAFSVFAAGVREQAIRSVKWAGLANILPRFITPAVTLILAGLLTPEDFGIVAASVAVVNLGAIVVEMGLGAAVIQRREELGDAAATAFWIAVGFSLALFGFVWLLAPTIAAGYGIGELGPVLRVSAITLVLAGLASVPKSLLVKRLSFKRLFLVDSIPQVVIAAVSLGIAVVRRDYWALVIGQVTGKAVLTALALALSGWRPSARPKWAMVVSLVRFSSWVFISNLMTWLFLFADGLLLGYLLGAGTLGIYSFGLNLSNMLPGMVSATLALVAYPAFCAIQDDRSEVGRSLLKLQASAAAVMFPLAFGLSAVAPIAVPLVYGDRWLGLGMVMAVLGIMPGLSHLWSLNADAFRAIGRPDLWTKASAITLAVLYPMLFFAGRMGLFAYVLARFLGAILLPALCVVFARRELAASYRQQWASVRGPTFAALLMYGLVVLGALLLRLSLDPPSMVVLVAAFGSGAVSYLVLLYWFDREVVMRTGSLVIRMLQSAQERRQVCPTSLS